MRINLVSSPRKIATLRRPAWLHLRAISGTALLAPDQQTLTDGGGLPVSVGDGIVSLNWENGDVFMAGQGGASEVEIVIPL